MALTYGVPIITEVIGIGIIMDWKRQREQMVRFQIRNRGVGEERILSAFLRVPRHVFVSDALRSESYCDHPLPIGRNQTVSQPYIVALMTQQLDVRASHRILEIGTGCGYQTAILGELANEVYSIEIIPELMNIARGNLQYLRYDNIHLRAGDGLAGWEEQAPFDGIIVTAAPATVPMPLLKQLKPGGEMVVPVGTLSQSLLRISKRENGKIVKKSIARVRFVPMTGEIAEGGNS